MGQILRGMGYSSTAPSKEESKDAERKEEIKQTDKNESPAQSSTQPADDEKKLETVEDIWQLYNDPVRLKSYRNSQPIISKKGINNEEFHMNLPYDEIKLIVEECRDRFMAAVPEKEREKLRWEHVGSTSIEGMPGAKMPDALLLIPEFPPSKGVIKAFLDSGYYFYGQAHLGDGDLWWLLKFTDGILEDHKLTVHVTTADNSAGKILLDMRDLCRSEEWAFNDYRDAKIAAAKGLLEGKKGAWGSYKYGKGANSKLLAMLREKHGMK